MTTEDRVEINSFLIVLLSLQAYLHIQPASFLPATDLAIALWCHGSPFPSLAHVHVPQSPPLIPSGVSVTFSPWAGSEAPEGRSNLRHLSHKVKVVTCNTKNNFCPIRYHKDTLDFFFTFLFHSWKKYLICVAKFWLERTDTH